MPRDSIALDILANDFLALELTFMDYTYEDIDIAALAQASLDHDKFTVINSYRSELAQAIYILNLPHRGMGIENHLIDILQVVSLRHSKFYHSEKEAILVPPDTVYKPTTPRHTLVLAVKLPRAVLESLPYSLQSGTSVTEWDYARSGHENPLHTLDHVIELADYRSPQISGDSYRLCNRTETECIDIPMETVYAEAFVAHLWCDLNGYDPGLLQAYSIGVGIPRHSRARDTPEKKENRIIDSLHITKYEF